MVTIERNVGRLVEIRPKGARDSAPMFGRVIALANELGPDAKVVVCVDARESDALGPEEIAKIRTAQVARRERVERLVTVVGPSPVRAMMAARVSEAVGELAIDVRTPAEAVQALSGLLTPAELVRLKLFLG